jgi:hypothetical protein
LSLLDSVEVPLPVVQLVSVVPVFTVYEPLPEEEETQVCEPVRSSVPALLTQVPSLARVEGVFRASVELSLPLLDQVPVTNRRRRRSRKCRSRSSPNLTSWCRHRRRCR